MDEKNNVDNNIDVNEEILEIDDIIICLDWFFENEKKVEEDIIEFVFGEDVIFSSMEID